MNKKVPVIRFSIFSSDWTEKKLKNIVDVNSGKNYKHLKKGNIPVYGTGGLMLHVDEAISDKDSIGIGRKGTIDKPFYLKAPFWTVDTLFFATPKQNSDLYYLLYRFKNINWLKYDESSSIPSLSKKTIENILINIPNTSEQTQIGNFFKNLDELMEYQQVYISSLKEMKKGFLKKLHPTGNKLKPIINISKLESKWNREKLSSLFEINTGKLNANAAIKNGIYPFVTCAKNILKTNSWNFEGPAITVAGNGVVGYTQIIEGRFDAYQRTYVLNEPKLDVYFLKNEIDLRIPREVQKSTNTSAMSYIVMDTIASLEIKVPDTYEVIDLLSSFFRQLDELIELEQQELKLLQEMKKGFLQKMFV